MKKIIAIFRHVDLRKKVLVVLGLLAVYRLLSAIPIPGVDASKLQQFFESNQMFGLLNMFSGGGLSTLSIVMLAVGPFITASIIMQLLTIIFPNLKKAYHEEGASGRAKFNRITRYISVPLAALQGYGFLNLLMAQNVISRLPLFDVITNVVIITAGSVLVMWIGELISEFKIGNGISLLIFAGIISAAPQALTSAFLNYSPSLLVTYIVFVVIGVIVIAGVVFVNEGERKVPVSYAKQVRGMKMYGGASTYLPLKVNQAGVIPIIFAISILLFPQFIAQSMALISPEIALSLNDWVTRFFNNQYIYSTLYFILVIMFTYFYTAVTFDPAQISKNLQKGGGFIPGIRPGTATTDVIAKIVHRTTLFGAIFLGVVAILPNVTQIVTGIQSLTLGGTGLLIVVSVALESMKQVESQLSLREYDNNF